MSCFVTCRTKNSCQQFGKQASPALCIKIAINCGVKVSRCLCVKHHVQNVYKYFRHIHISYTGQLIGEYQGGFRKGPSTAEHINFSPCDKLYKNFTNVMYLYNSYIIFKQAFHSISLLYTLKP
jgi:hypothetical protein